jgi:hypothetical protein
MIDPRALELAKREGYRPHGNWQHMFCDFAFWKCLAKAVKYEGEPLELAQEFLPLIFAATHPVDLEGYHDQDHHLRIVWDDLVEPAEEETPFAVVKPDVLYMCRYGANVSEEAQRDFIRGCGVMNEKSWRLAIPTAAFDHFSALRDRSDAEEIARPDLQPVLPQERPPSGGRPATMSSLHILGDCPG